ncbi:MAG TPA: hypothetical protein VHD63_07260, partial [Ktedonobacteraceae bacterium]|nr:hypothetical protein [Ktedonobacteraceae bacterium]
ARLVLHHSSNSRRRRRREAAEAKRENQKALYSLSLASQARRFLLCYSRDMKSDYFRFRACRKE